MTLTDAKIRNTKSSDKPIRLTDGGGLYLEVRPTGVKLWRYRYRIAGKENLFAVGDYPTLGLANARALRAAARQLVKQGIHPAHDRRAARLATHAANANTFEAVAREWIDKKKTTGPPTTVAKSNGSLPRTSSPTSGPAHPERDGGAPSGNRAAGRRTWGRNRGADGTAMDLGRLPVRRRDPTSGHGPRGGLEGGDPSAKDEARQATGREIRSQTLRRPSNPMVATERRSSSCD